jgi:hypothetical protein
MGQYKASPFPSEVYALGVDCGAAMGRLESRKQSVPTPRKNFCACVNLTKICLADVVSWRQMFRRLSKTQNGSDKERLRCFAFSVKTQMG